MNFQYKHCFKTERAPLANLRLFEMFTKNNKIHDMNKKFIYIFQLKSEL